MMWDFFTPDNRAGNPGDLGARIDTSPGSISSGYSNLKASVALLWQGTPGTPEEHNAIYRVYVANETDNGVALSNNTDIVTYKLIATANSKDLIDLINGDPLNAVSNSMSNIQNAVEKSADGFLVSPGTAPPPPAPQILTWTGTADTEKVWASPYTSGTAFGEVPVNYSGGGGNDVIYGRNNSIGTVETLSGGAGDDLLVGRAGHDELHGGDGNDWLYGSLGKDTIYGDAGNDRLFGAYGHDQLYGGTGADVFLTRIGDFDTVHDFQYSTTDAANNDMVYIWWETRDVNPGVNPHNTVDGTPDRYTDADGGIHASYKQLDGTEFLKVAYDHRNGYVYLNNSAVMELLDGNGGHPDVPVDLIGISTSGDANDPNPGIFIT